MKPAYFALIAFLCLSACKKDSRSNSDCESRARDFAVYAADVAEDSLSVVHRTKLLSTDLRPMARPRRRFGEVEVHAQRIVVGTRAVSDGTLEAMANGVAEQLGGDDGTWRADDLYVSVDDDAPWWHVVAVAHAAEKLGVKELRFVVGATARAAQPPKSRYHQQLATEVPASALADALAAPTGSAVSENIFKDCKRALAVLPRYASESRTTTRERRCSPGRFDRVPDQLRG